MWVKIPPATPLKYMKTTEKIQKLFEVHDFIEQALIKGSQIEGYNLKLLWKAHDLVERDIISLESRLSDEALEQLNA